MIRSTVARMMGRLVQDKDNRVMVVPAMQIFILDNIGRLDRIVVVNLSLPLCQGACHDTRNLSPCDFHAAELTL